uniref:Histone H1 n=1 Tax=mine drainage metagenome TaxID=410659 RepID=E6PRT0_9ZZZZ
MKTRTGKKLDLNQLAKAIVDEATGEAPRIDAVLTGKKANSQRGGLKGGVSRMSELTETERSALAKKAAGARWGKEKAASGMRPDAGKTTSTEQH